MPSGSSAFFKRRIIATSTSLRECGALLRSNISPSALNQHSDPVYSFGMPAGVGVLVCEALRERSEQRANKYPAAACNVEWWVVAGWGPLLQEDFAGIQDAVGIECFL